MQREMRPAYILTLLARGRPIGESTRDGIAKFFDVAHNLIVGGFAEVTTEEMHAIWEVEEVDN
jgi:hypothetical protein